MVMRTIGEAFGRMTAYDEWNWTGGRAGYRLVWRNKKESGHAGNALQDGAGNAEDDSNCRRLRR